jgi:hypothetical protein
MRSNAAALPGTRLVDEAKCGDDNVVGSLQPTSNTSPTVHDNCTENSMSACVAVGRLDRVIVCVLLHLCHVCVPGKAEALGLFEYFSGESKDDITKCPTAQQ